MWKGVKIQTKRKRKNFERRKMSTSLFYSTKNEVEQKHATKKRKKKKEKRNYYPSFLYFQLLNNLSPFTNISLKLSSCNNFSFKKKKSTNFVVFFKTLHIISLWKLKKKESISIQGHPKQNFYLKCQSPRKKKSFFGMIKMFSIKKEKWCNNSGLNIWC